MKITHRVNLRVATMQEHLSDTLVYMYIYIYIYIHKDNRDNTKLKIIILYACN